MDIKVIFRALARDLMSSFEKSREVDHNTTKGNYREDALARFISDKIPGQYKVLKGEIVSSKTGFSKHFDLIIFDASKAPIWDSEGSISVVPIEGVCGVIEVKSTLSKEEVLDGFRKIYQLKDMVPRDRCQLSGPVVRSSFARPLPFGIVFGYKLGSNSLSSLTGNLKEFESSVGRGYWPNGIVVLNEGVIQHFGEYENSGRTILSTKDFLDRKVENLRPFAMQFGDETLFEFTNMLYELLNSMYIPEFNPGVYRRAPRKIGAHWVFNAGVKVTASGWWFLNERAIEQIITYCKKITRRPFADIANEMMGASPDEVLPSARNSPHFLYNPDGLPGIHETKEFKIGGEAAVIEKKIRVLTPFFILVIDGEDYVLPAVYIEDSWLEPDGNPV